MRSILVALLFMLGCERGASEVSVVVVAAPPAAVTTCASIGGDQLGQLPLSVALGDDAIAFAEWSLPDEQSTDVVGFAASLPKDVTFTVKAGADEFHGDSPRWLHPRGVSGPRVRPVERITFCRTAVPQVVASR
jgi:hypothetical protein